jgi:hypothetical protein
MADADTNLIDLVSCAESGMVPPHYQHPLLITDVVLPSGPLLENQDPYILVKLVKKKVKWSR